jgi:hypothetical protein
VLPYHDFLDYEMGFQGRGSDTALQYCVQFRDQLSCQQGNDMVLAVGVHEMVLQQYGSRDALGDYRVNTGFQGVQFLVM